MAQTAGEDRIFSQGIDLGFSVSHSVRDAYRKGSVSETLERTAKNKIVAQISRLYLSN